MKTGYIPIEAINVGARAARRKWITGFVYLSSGSVFPARSKAEVESFGMFSPMNIGPHYLLCSATHEINYWTPSVEDMLADDWFIIGENVVSEEVSQEKARIAKETTRKKSKLVKRIDESISQLVNIWETAKNNSDSNDVSKMITSASNQAVDAVKYINQLSGMFQVEPEEE